MYFVHTFTGFWSDDSRTRFLKQLLVLTVVEVVNSKFFYHRGDIKIHVKSMSSQQIIGGIKSNI